ncbi:5-formyltetrahydrofolate cyclo-ligase [Paenibacillus sp. M1]|uniref:5-formyltetrahydrofolate cyclo-ligase n=1 Tax=Paenibacillus haidiansis TaxID=1574488 RepID=A0ABU7VW13_9BACL
MDNIDIGASKKALRTRMAGIRSGIPPESRKAQALEACRIAELEVLDPLRKRRNAGLTIFSYLSFRDEPDTSPLLRSCLERGDTILVPKIIGNGTMSLHNITGRQNLVSGVWGIPEPDGTIPAWPAERYGEIDLVLVPGLAFDRYGGRIGFGGGYYDRFIAELAKRPGARGRDEEGGSALKAALAFEEQIVDETLPAEKHDLKLDMLFTASGILYIEGK